ncbi:MAG: hypothetical protein GXO60_00490 [Epsilonproteobacteria bacterium]|nr:hypothetical protein [Campylobacterota bacterium]
MFNSEDDNKEEISFADAYKSQILNKNDEEETSSKNLIIILLLVAIVIGLSIFGYIYMSKMSQSEVQNSEVKKVKVIKEITEEEPPKSNMLNNINELIDEEPTEEKNLDNSEIDTSKNSNTKKDKVEVKENKKGVKQKGEETYLEQLAELSKEIDGEAKKK